MTSQAVLIEDVTGQSAALRVVNGPEETPSPGQKRIEKLLERSRNNQKPATRRLRLVARLGKPVAQPAVHPVDGNAAPIVQPAWDPSEIPDDTGRVREWLDAGQPPEDIGFRSLAAAANVGRGATPSIESVEKLAGRLPEVLSDALSQLETANDKRTKNFLSRATQEFDGRLGVLEQTLDRLAEHVDKAAARHTELPAAPVHAAPPAQEINALRTEMTLKLLTLLFAGAALFSMAMIIRGVLG